jgi:hypothetical protein
LTRPFGDWLATDARLRQQLLALEDQSSRFDQPK